MFMSCKQSQSTSSPSPALLPTPPLPRQKPSVVSLGLAPEIKQLFCAAGNATQQPGGGLLQTAGSINGKVPAPAPAACSNCSNATRSSRLSANADVLHRQRGAAHHAGQAAGPDQLQAVLVPVLPSHAPHLSQLSEANIKGFTVDVHGGIKYLPPPGLTASFVLPVLAKEPPVGHVTPLHAEDSEPLAVAAAAMVQLSRGEPAPGALTSTRLGKTYQCKVPALQRRGPAPTHVEAFWLHTPMLQPWPAVGSQHAYLQLELPALDLLTAATTKERCVTCVNDRSWIPLHSCF